MFPLNLNETTRHSTRFVEEFCRGAKLYKSTIPSMIRELNKYYKENKNQVVITTKAGEKNSVCPISYLMTIIVVKDVA